MSAVSFANAWGAEIDYSHCIEHIGEYKENNPFPPSKGYSMTRSGEVIIDERIAASPQVEVVREKGRTFVRVRQGGGIYLDIRRKNDVVTEIRESQNGSVTKFDVRGGKCLVTEIAKTKDSEEPMINTDLCHELETYVAKNPESAECRCGNEKTDKDLAIILRKYIPTYNGMTRPKKIAHAGWEDLGGPAAKAYEKMSFCHSQHDIKAMLNDPALWPNAGAPGSQPGDAKANH